MAKIDWDMDDIVLPNDMNQIGREINDKVDKVSGKSLSTNDYTTAEKTKLAGIATGANAYVHPTGDGNLHIPVTGTASNGKVLKAGATAGSASWSTLTKLDISDFPASLPANGGDADTVDGLHASTGSTANTVAARQGNGNLQAAALISTVAAGTAPLQVTSTTLVTNLNADLLDGYHADDADTASTIALRGLSGGLTGRVLIATAAQGTAPLQVGSSTVVKYLNADSVDGYHADIANNINTVVVRGSTGNISVQGVLSKLGTAAGGAVHYALQSGELNRFGIGLGGVESGGDAGSQLQIYSYNDAGAWVRTVLAIDRVTGDAAFSNNVSAARLISRIGTGTAPLVVSSTTVVSNLNADMVDGFHMNQDVRTTATPYFAGLRVASASATGLVVERNSNTVNAAIEYRTTGSSVFAGHGSAGTFGIGPDANLSAAAFYVEASTGNTWVRRLTSTVATGTAPFTVVSSTLVSNLNADMVDGYHAATADTANTLATRDASRNLTAKTFISTAGRGEAPIQTTSTELVPNLNAEMVGGFNAKSFVVPIANTTGNSTAYVAAFLPQFEKMHGQGVRIRPHTASGTNPTLNANATGAAPIRNADGSAAKLAASGIYTLIWDEFSSAFILQGEGGGTGGMVTLVFPSTAPFGYMSNEIAWQFALSDPKLTGKTMGDIDAVFVYCPFSGHMYSNLGYTTYIANQTASWTALTGSLDNFVVSTAVNYVMTLDVSVSSGTIYVDLTSKISAGSFNSPANARVSPEIRVILK